MGPLATLERSRPDRRATAALELFERTLGGWVALLPESVDMTGADAARLASELGGGSAWSGVAGLRKAPRPVPLRALAAAALERAREGRADADRACVVLLSDLMRVLGREWTRASLAADRSVDRTVTEAHVERERREVVTRRARAEAALERATRHRREWLRSRLLPEIGAAVVRSVALGRKERAPGTGPTRPTRPPPEPADLQRHLARAWAGLRLDAAIDDFQDALLGALDGALARALEDEEALRAELERLIPLLGGARPGAAVGAPAVEVVSARARLEAMDLAAEAAIDGIPERPLPPSDARRADHPGSSRPLSPVAVLGDVYREAIRPACRALFEHVERAHAEIAADQRRACDVVAYAARAETAAGGGAAVMEEAIGNAVALLELRRRAPPGSPSDGVRAAAAICRGARDARVALFGGRVQRWVHGARRELERGVPAATAALAALLARRAGDVVRVARGSARRGLARIGWSRDYGAGATEVRVRPLLPDEFNVDPGSVELPALYRHLFSPDPVKEVRFLVGRGEELAALADARARWEAGHAAAVVVTGERGSGKTSLINCALQGALAGLPLSRGEFGERVLDAATLRAKVAEIVDVADPADLERELGASRRVVVIEELERTFLRHIGRYEAVRALGRLINTTSETVLWVVVVNQVAFRFLDASIGLGQRFSHRLNAGTATADDLRSAVMGRHELTGLRLRFESPPEPGLSQRLQTRLGRRADPERAFFQVAARQSGGVYRTAFNIWLGHLEPIRDREVRVKAPVVRDLAPIIADLQLTDLFSLVAMLQHGSLTEEEHATVFQLPSDESHAQIDELVARDIVAPDPGRPGFRVRPEAMAVVQEALFRRNLL